MKKKFKVDIHANGTLNDPFIKLITNHNEGKCNISLGIFLMYAKCRYAEWPTITPDFTIIEHSPAHLVEVKENDKHTLTIQEVEVFELSETDQEIENELSNNEDVKNIL